MTARTIIHFVNGTVEETEAYTQIILKHRVVMVATETSLVYYPFENIISIEQVARRKPQ